MAHHYGFFIGQSTVESKTFFQLEHDLTATIARHGGELVKNAEHSLALGAAPRRSVSRLYEIPGKGAIDVVVVSDRSIQAGIDRFDGLVACLGFDQKAEPFLALHKDLIALCEVYGTRFR